jgi:hypothetical protein
MLDGNVSAVIVTRGDIDIQPVIDSIPKEWEIVVWDNSGTIQRSDGWAEVCTDMSVFGRYAALDYCSHDLIYVQDDDVIVSDPTHLVERWAIEHSATAGGILPFYTDLVVCNMPPEFRHEFYRSHALVGFGGVFHREQAAKCFERLFAAHLEIGASPENVAWFHRCCDIALTGLSRRLLVDVPKENREMASDDNRMWKQPNHVSERIRMLDLVIPLRMLIQAEEEAELARRLFTTTEEAVDAT